MLDIVVLNYNDSQQTIRYLRNISSYKNIGHIAVVDNNSTDKSFEELKKYENAKIHVIQSGRNGGYGYGNNYGVKYLCSKHSSRYIAITNPDVEYSQECLNACEQFLEKHKNEKYAIVAPKMKNILGEVVTTSAWMIPTWKEYTFFPLGVLGKRYKLKYANLQNENDGYIDCDCVAGSMLVVDAKAFKEMGMYDEDIFLYCEETVLGIRAKSVGYKTAILTNYSFVHAHSVSINKAIKSKLKQLDLMWQSRMFTLEKYYHIGRMKKWIVKISWRLSLLESWIIDKIRQAQSMNKKGDSI